MKLAGLHFVVIAVLTHAFAWAQQPSHDSTNGLTFENGSVVNGIYSNERFGFSLPIPAGWAVNDAVAAGGKAQHRAGKSLLLLYLHQQGKPGAIILNAWDSAGHNGPSHACPGCD